MNHRVQVKIAEYESENGIEISTEDDKSLNEESVLSIFRDGHILAYKHGNKWRALDKKKEKFLEPKGGWGSRKYVVVKGKKIKFRLTNSKLGLSDEEIKDRLQSYGIVETQKYNKTNKVGFVIIKFISDAHLETMKTQQHRFELTEVVHTDSEVRVAEYENENGIEISTEDDKSLNEKSVLTHFPECFALAYKQSNNKTWEAVANKNGRFLPPQGGWGSKKYVCVKGKKIKYELTNIKVDLTEQQIKEHLQSFGIVELEKFDRRKKKNIVTIKFISDAHLKNIYTQQHPFKIHEVLNDDREKFTKRGGTTNKGHKFEELTVASLLLNLTLDKNVQDFKLSSNDDEFGSFDDIVIDVTLTNGDKRIYALQLKYKNESNKFLTKKFLTSMTGDFSLQKYFKDFTDMIEYTKNYNLILFTNLKFDIPNDNNFELDSTEINLNVQVEKKIGEELGIGSCYKFNPSNQNISHQRKTFFNKFLLCPNQPNVQLMEQNLSRKFYKQFSFNDITKYLKFVVEWNDKCKKKKLNKMFITQLIALQMLDKYIKTFPTVKKTNNENLNLLKKVILDFTVTVVDEKHFKNIKKIWENETVTVSEIEKEISDFQFEDLDDDKKRVIALWIMNKCPLIITGSETASKVITLCSENVNKHFVLLNNNDTAVFADNLKVFTRLTDLKPNSTIYENIIKSFYCSIQGKQAINLKDLIKQCKNFETFVTANELIQMLDGPLRIGKQETVLDIYIDRFVTRLTIDDKFFDCVDKDTLVIVSCQGRENILKRRLKHFRLINIEDYLNQKGEMQIDNYRSHKQTDSIGRIQAKIAYFSKNICTRKSFDIICSRNPSKKCHHFRIIEDEDLEWMYSKGEINDLQKYKTSSSFLKESDLISVEETINIITADPGMGKTELMKKFNNMYSSAFWTFLITAKDWPEYLKKELCGKDKFFEILFKNCQTKFEIDVLNAFKNTKRIKFLWDGLDELSNTQVDTAISLIDELVKENFKQWISCRNHLENKLEKKFNVLSRSIKQFDKDEQRNYIIRRLDTKVTNLEQVVQKIQDFIARVQCNETSGIPLQIFMFTELLLNQPRLLHTLLNEIFPITDLYKYFIEMKLQRFLKQKVYNITDEAPQKFQPIMTDFQKNQLRNHQKKALRLIIQEQSLFNKLSIYLNSNSNEEIIYGIGIITGKTSDGQSQFLHYSYAEYFVALYFYERRKQFNLLIKELIFQEHYQNVRFMFDLLLAKECPAHLAVLYNNFDYLKSCQKYYKCKDEGGRNPLQIACTWGPRFPLLKTDDFQISEAQAGMMNLSSKQHYDGMLNLLLEFNSPLDKDLLFDLNSVEYADLSLSLKPLAIFSRDKFHISWHTLKNFNDIFTILYYSTKFNYSSILSSLQNIPAPQIMKYSNTLLHLASKNNSLDCIKVLLKDQNYSLMIDAKNQYCETPIFNAIENGHYEVVKYLAESGADVNIQDQDGNVPIHIAAKKGHFAVVRLLVNDLKVDVNAKNYEGTTPVYLAAQNGHHEIVKYFAEKRADVNIPDYDGWAPIHAAAVSGHIKVVKILINDLKANINAKDKNGFTPIYLASLDGRHQVVRFLARSRADLNIKDQDGWSPIHAAAFKGHIEVVRLLVNNLGLNVNVKDNKGINPIYLAAQNGHYDVVKYLAESRADVNIQNQDGWSPIHAAAFKGHIEVVRLLVNNLGLNVNVKDNKGINPIYLAAQNGHYEVVKYLVESGADVNIQDQDGCGLIHISARRGHIQVVKLLVKDLKANVNTKENKNLSPIYLAVENGHYEVVKYLAESGADVNIQNNQDGYLPIHLASQNGHIEVVKLLINVMKTNVNVRTKEGFTPIYLAAGNGHHEVVKYLAECGANMNIQNKKDNVLIHMAAFNGHIEVVKLLVHDLKSNVNLRTNKGITPIYLAAQNGHYEIVKYLAESGANVNIVYQDGFILIHVAALNGHIEVVKLLVNELTSDVNAKTKKGFTPIYLAAQKGHYEVVKYLSESRANVNIVYQDGLILIHVAALNGHIEVVKLLVNELTIDVNAKTKKGFTPIYLAAQNGHYEVVKYLAESGADVNVQNQDGFAPIHSAAQNGHLSVIRVLVNDLNTNINARDYKGHTPIYIAAQYGNYEVVKYLAESEADINIQKQDGYAPIHIAAKKGNIAVIKCLAESGADVNIQNQDGYAPIHIAALNGHIEVVKLLVNNFKANMNVKTKKGYTPIYVAVYKGHYEVVKYLSESGADVNIQNRVGLAAIHIGALNGHIEIIKFLVNDQKIKMNTETKEGFTPIYLAAMNCHYEVVKYLVESGADVNIQNKDGLAAIHIGALNGHIGVIRVFVSYLRIDVNAKDNEGFTPIYFAAQNGHYEVVKYLAESGADVNIPDQNGLIPIHIAAFNGHIKVVQLLVSERGINFNALTKKGFTSIYLAAENGHYEIVKYLVESGADVNIKNEADLLPIHIAAFKGHVKLIRLFVNDLNININIKNSEGLTPIYLAAQGGHCELVKYLMESRADVNIQNQDGWVPIHIAALNGHLEVVKLLLRNKRINCNAQTKKGFTPIFLSAKTGFHEVVKYLAQSGADVNIKNQEGWIPIHIGAFNGHFEVVRVLVVNLRINNLNAKTKKGFTPIYVAAEKGHPKVIKYLANAGADVNIQDIEGLAPIHIAAENGHIEVVKLIVSLKTNVNSKSIKGFTPIYLAAKNGHHEVVKYLAQSGADVNIQNQNGDCPVHVAALNGHMEVVKLLVNKLKVNVNAKNKNKFTPFCLAVQHGHYKLIKYLAKLGRGIKIHKYSVHIAAENGHIEVVKLLVNDLKLKRNAKNEKGSTPIYLAAQNGHYEVVKYLAETGADVNIQNYKGMTPVHIAAFNGYKEIVALLVNDLSVNAKNINESTPIYLAAQKGHHEVVKFLAESGADVNIPQKDGWMPIHVAAFQGHIETVKLLVSYLETSIHARNFKGFTPVDLAHQKGHTEITKYFLQIKDGLL